MAGISNLISMIQRTEEEFQGRDKNWHDLLKLLLHISVQKNTAIDIRPFEPADFTNTEELVCTCFNMLEKTFKNSEVNILDSLTLECVYRIILLCGEHSSKALWSNDTSIQLSEQVLKNLLKSLNFENLSTFLTEIDSRRKLHGVNMFVLLSPKLSKDEWKYYPAAVHCYIWLLSHVKSRMGEFLCVVLPVSLNVLNDYQVQNKIIALKCLRHILQNVSKAEFNWHMQIELLINIVKPLLYYREADLIIPLVDCTLEIASKKDFPFIDSEDLQWRCMDDILSIVLSMMEFEQDINRRCAYGESLYAILTVSKLSIMRWCPKLLRILDDYSKTNITELVAMKTLYQFTLCCWPFLHDHWRMINVIAGRIVYRSKNKEAVEIAENILRRLEKCEPSNSEIRGVEYIRKKRNEKKE